MDALIDVVKHVHVWNAWIILTVGCIVVGTLAMEARHHQKTEWGGRSNRVFVGLVHLQVVLGPLLMILKVVNDDELFSGNDAKAFWHAVLGITAAVLVTISLRLRRRSDRFLATFLIAAAALIAANLARLPLVVVGALVCFGLAELLRRRSSGGAPAGGRAPAEAADPAATTEEPR